MIKSSLEYWERFIRKEYKSPVIVQCTKVYRNTIEAAMRYWHKNLIANGYSSMYHKHVLVPKKEDYELRYRQLLKHYHKNWDEIARKGERVIPVR
ncbi:hypothetical protein SAMN05444392_106146 [Seinonella peptonophila]|uniref:Uncharacterized protein n=1 Tax=Seinonella peptonophila TaxID=112248 RepID=A0A1M4YBS4_9BACL|nr:hypothetical protein SAMN05444392_106146 [Seinonella peptonophila]